MTAVPSLFDPPFPVRDSDPAPSHEGAAMPHLRAMQEHVLVALVELGDCTPWQIVDRLAGPESGSVRSRLSELAHLGLVERAGSHRERRGSANTVWRATDDGRRMVAWLAERKAS